MILSFRTDRSGQTVQTQIRLLLFAIPSATWMQDYGKAILFKFRVITANFSCVRIFRNFTVHVVMCCISMPYIVCYTSCCCTKATKPLLQIFKHTALCITLEIMIPVNSFKQRFRAVCRLLKQGVRISGILQRNPFYRTPSVYGPAFYFRISKAAAHTALLPHLDLYRIHSNTLAYFCFS